MAFGIKREELNDWKQKVSQGDIAFLTHYWMDDRFPNCTSVTKVGCKDLDKLIAWGEQYGLKKEWLHVVDDYPHFDLFGDLQEHVLTEEKIWDQLNRFCAPTKKGV